MIINQKIKNNSHRNGFTLIELLVAMSLFIIIITIAVGSFISAMRTQRILVALMAVNDNASLAIEQMAREIRVGTGFPVSGANCSTLNNLTFTNYLGDQIRYWAQNGSLLKSESSNNNVPVPITASNVNIKRMNFCVLNRVDANNIPIIPARVTILLEVAVSSTGAVGLQGVATDLQTTISARNSE
ncbi:MAG: type II secretion system protein [Candidatus Paceibacterota bacterium]|jgi:prepilin-type N-terminal cleavage/methylation domain-containing protein